MFSRHSSMLCLLVASLAIGCSASESSGPKGGSGGDPVVSVSMVSAPTELEVSESKAASATAKNAAGVALAGRTIAWSSSNDGVASVNPSGMINGVAPGSVTITATSEGKSATATFKVDTRTANLAAILESVRSSYDLLALAGGITTRTGMFGKAAVGRRRATQSTPVTADDLWHIGSNLKAISAYVAAIAVSEGKITWSTTLAEAYPELAGTMRAEYRNVTLRQLLGHIGGLIPNVPDVALAGGGTLTTQRATIAKWATSLAPTNAVGVFNYSNVGYMIAANMVERSMGSSWESIMQSKLLGPLSITAFGWGAAPSAQNPVGHQRTGSTWTEYPDLDNPPFLSAAGRSHWSLDAYGKVLQEILKADQGLSALGVTQANARMNTTAQPGQNYGSGWFVSTPPWANGRGVDHDGSNNLNYMRTQAALDRGVAVYSVTNSHDTNSTRSNDAMIQAEQRLWAYYSAHSN